MLTASGTNRRRLQFFLSMSAALTVGCLVLITVALEMEAWLLPLWGAVSAVLVSEAMLGIVIASWCSIAGRRVAPRLDFKDGIPNDCRTLVAIPMLLTEERLQQTIVRLEEHYLANASSSIVFALLTDFPDSSVELGAGESERLRVARNHIARLNARHSDAEQRFFLLHRKREWNATEERWMGRERKRGKLEDLNALLLRGETRAFCIAHETINALGSIAYVITLDADTRMPNGAARRLIETIAVHCRGGRPVQDAAGSVLQPSMLTIPDRDLVSTFEALHGDPPESAHSTRPIPNFYQDVFGEGSFYGKGIYHVASFDQALANCVPDNWILSHDLLEGCYAGSTAATDIFLIESSPQSYLAEAQRAHRWTRGDWQLLPWIMWLRGPRRCNRKLTDHSGLSRWKMLDNLRRSLVAPSTLVTLTAGWHWARPPYGVTLFVVAALLTPAVFGCGLRVLFGRDSNMCLRSHVSNALRQLSIEFCRTGLQIITLPHKAWTMLDAIGRSLWRMGMSGQRLLVWVESAEAERIRPQSLKAYLRTLWICPAFSVLAVIMLPVRPIPLDVVLITALWFIAPAIIFAADQPRRRMSVVSSTATMTNRRHQAA